MTTRSACLVLALLLLAACGGVGTGPSASGGEAAAAPSAPAGSTSYEAEHGEGAAYESSVSVKPMPFESGEPSSLGDIGAITDAGKLVVLIDVDESPYAFRSSDGGFEGLNTEFARIFSNEFMSGVAVEFIDLEQAQLLPAIADGLGDIAIGRITKSAEGTELVELSAGYCPNEYHILALDSDMDAEDIGSGKLAVTGEAAHAAAQERYESAELILYDTVAEAVEAIRAGDADALIADTPTRDLAFWSHGELAQVDTIPMEEELAVAMAKGRPILLENVNRYITDWWSGGYGYSSLTMKKLIQGEAADILKIR